MCRESIVRVIACLYRALRVVFDAKGIRVDRTIRRAIARIKDVLP